MPFCELLRSFVIDKTRKTKFLYNTIRFPLVKKDYDPAKIYRKTHKKGASQTYDTPSFSIAIYSIMAVHTSIFYQ